MFVVRVDKARAVPQRPRAEFQKKAYHYVQTSGPALAELFLAQQKPPVLSPFPQVQIP
jgi:hypothetical protein